MADALHAELTIRRGATAWSRRKPTNVPDGLASTFQPRCSEAWGGIPIRGPAPRTHVVLALEIRVVRVHPVMQFSPSVRRQSHEAGLKIAPHR